MFRRVIAGIILGPALLLGSFAWWGFLALRTVFDEDRTATIAEELLENDEVVEQIGNGIGDALQRTVGSTIDLNEDEVNASVDVILASPGVRELIVDAMGTTHRAFLGLDDAPSEIDIGPALESSKAGLAIFREDIADLLPDEFVIELPTERIPNASPVISFLERTVPLLAGMAVTMALLAFLTTSDRSQVLGKAARWAIGTTAFYLIVGLGVPYLLRTFAPDGWQVLAALLTAILRAALIPSIVLGAVGAVLLLLSMFWPDPARDRKERRREPAPVAAPAAAVAPQPQPAPRPVAAQPAPQPRPAPPAASPPVAPPTPEPAPRPRPADRPSAPVESTSAAWSPPPAADPTAAMTPPPAAPEPRPAPAVPDPSAPLPPPRPTLPTRAKPPESVDLPAWTGDPPGEAAAPPEPAAPEAPRWRPPTWVDGHGWVMDPDDPRQPPNNARFVDGVGWVVPGPPPE